MGGSKRPAKANALRMTTMTTIDWPMMYRGVPKKRAMRSAIARTGRRRKHCDVPAPPPQEKRRAVDGQ